MPRRLRHPQGAGASEPTFATYVHMQQRTLHIRGQEATPVQHFSLTGDDTFDGRWDRPKLTPAAAITALGGNGGRVQGTGVHVLTAPLVVPNGVEVVGVGKRPWVDNVDKGLVLRAHASFPSGQSLVDLSGVSGGTQAEDKALKNLTLDGANVAGVGGAKVWNFRDITLEDVFIRRCPATSLSTGNTIAADTANQLNLTRVQMANGGKGLSTSGSIDKVFLNAQDCEISNMTDDGVEGSFTGYFLGGQVRGVLWGFDLDKILGFSIIGTNLENCDTGDIHVGPDANNANFFVVASVGSTTINGPGRDFGIWVESCEGGSILVPRITVHALDSTAFVGLQLDASARSFDVAGAMFSGTYTSGTRAKMVVGNLAHHRIFHSLFHRSLFAFAAASGAFPLQLFRETAGVVESKSRWRGREDGRFEWSDGTANHDVQMERKAANVLGLAADDVFLTGKGATGSRPSASAVGEGAQWFDSTLHRPIWSDGTDWRGPGAPVVIPLIAQNATVTWTDMPAAETEFNGGTGRTRTRVDLTDMKEARLVASVTSTGAVGAELRVQYSTDLSAWSYLDASAGPACAVQPAALPRSGSWVALAAGAKADVYVRLVGINGDAVADPAFGLIVLQVR